MSELYPNATAVDEAERGDSELDDVFTPIDADSVVVEDGGDVDGDE